MTDRSPTLPSWVSKRDGRLVPFDADQISRSLFAATEALGRPDTFLARELTDAVVHFLARESEGPVAASSQIADLVIKVVRELGHSALSQVFADFAARRTRQPGPKSTTTAEPSPALPFPGLPAGWLEAAGSPSDLAWETTRTCLRHFALRTVFTRDLVAAHEDSLLNIGNLEAPRELAGLVLTVRPGASDLVEAIEQARQLAGSYLAIDGAEHALVETRSDASASFARELGIGLRATGLAAVVNLNCAAPPSWAGDLAEGPLFAEEQRPFDDEKLTHVRLALLDRLATLPGIRLDWHLAERDFLPEGAGLLNRLARIAAEGTELAFVFDRPRRPVALAEGLDRQHPALLQTVSLHLPRLAAQASRGRQPPEAGAEESPRGTDALRSPDAELFLRKLGSLARLALSVAAQKRDFLRRHNHAGLTRGFLLDRARLAVVPVGLEAVVQSLSGSSTTEKAGLELARRIVESLRDFLDQDGKVRLLETCVDSAVDFGINLAEGPPLPGEVAGLTGWNPTATARQQLRAAATLQAAAAAGTTVIPLFPEQRLSLDEVLNVLQYAWQQTDAVRLRFVRLPSPVRQLTL